MFHFRFSHNHKAIVPMVIAVVTLIIIIVFLCKGCSSDNTGLHTPQLPDIQLNGDNGYVANSGTQGVKLNAMTGVVFRSGTKTQSVNLSNDKENNCLVVASIYLADGTLLYESDYIHPEGIVTTIDISKELDAGLYRNALLVYRCYSISEPHIPITQCEFGIEIRCLKS